MKVACWISLENVPLAVEEIKALSGSKNHELISDLVVVECANPEVLKRLAFTREVFKYLFKCEKRELTGKMQIFYWQKEYEKNFKLQLHHTNEFKEKDLAGYIYNNIKNAKVNLKNPSTKFDLFFINNSIFALKSLFEINENFTERRPHLRPEHHPSSMSPKLARALVNLTGIKKGVLCDPFCGSGGILIEAGLMNFSPIGYDIYDFMLKKAEKNIDFYKIKNCTLINQDSTKIKKSIDFIATDLPYGRGTKKINPEKLYFRFLSNLKKILNKRAVIMFPNFVNYRKLIKKAKLRIKKEFSIYVHHTLTRKIVVIDAYSTRHNL